MIIALFVGFILGASYAWVAHQHHRVLLAADGGFSPTMIALSTLVRLICVAGIVALIMRMADSEQMRVLSALVIGYAGVMIWANRRR